MNLSSKLKKHILWVFLLPVLFLLVVGGIVYFFAVYRFKDSIKFIIDKESKGKFSFDASDATLSVWNRSILLTNSVLYSRDTTGAKASFKVQIPEIYFSVTSWKDILFHKKIIVDSLSIIEPFIDIDIRTTQLPQQPGVFHAGDIVGYLQKALSYFNVHSFSLKDAAFRYTRVNSPIPLSGDHINLNVSNFSVVNNEDSHLLGSDMVSIHLGKQHWVLPDGKHEINFNRMTFDSKGQRFELDSFSFYQAATTGTGAIRLRADKFFFNSRHLPAIYQKEQLLLDTVSCINPVLSIPGYPREDSTQQPRFNSTLFKRINIGFVDVTDGELILQNKKGRSANAATQRANLRIFNLNIHPAGDSSITTDSIRINLKKIEFLTRDSLYQLSIGEFAFHGNDALFKDVRFEPANPNFQGRKVEFTAPSLLLKNISLIDLMRKHLRASGAELKQPLIILYDKQLTAGTGANLAFTGTNLTAQNKPPGKSSEKKLALFYRTLHHVSELINTRDFTVINGAVRYQLTATTPLKATIEDLNAHLLLHKFFISDSLVDIKHAIPDWRIGQIHLSWEGVDINVTHYSFNGIGQLSQGQQVQISTAGGMQLTGDNIYWNIFDWDVFQKTRDIQVDALHADHLTIRIPPKKTDSSSHPGNTPSIRIGQLAVNEISIDGGPLTNPFHLTINDLQAADIKTSGHYFTWTRLNAVLHDIAVQGKKSKTSIREIDFDSDKGIIVKDLAFQSQGAADRIRIASPLIRLSTGWHSSNLTQLTIASLFSDTISTAYHRSGKDTIEGSISGRLQGQDLQFTRNNGQPTLLATIHFEWNNAALHYQKDSIALSLNGMAGSIDARAFHWSPAVSIGLQQLATATTISKGDLAYHDKTISAGAAGFAWDPHDQQLSLRQVSILPNASRETTFTRAKWQRDYITLQGNALSIAGIRYDPHTGDSSVSVRKIILDGITLTASRDKRIPFRHGTEKLMPTKLINAIPFPIRIDSLWVQHSKVTYDECSAATQKWSSVPIEDIDGRIVQLSNRNNQQDTLSLIASGKIFDGRIRRFYYKESYGDSLSGFSARAYLSAIDLTRLSEVSIPAANVSVTGGRADTLYSSWQGNKYASYGTMNFYYAKLKIKVLNKKDSAKRGFLPTLETGAANLILPNHRQRTTAIFFERDREKFVFNYWVKSQLSGILTTLGLKSDRTYQREYEKISQQFSLPAQPPR